MLVGLSNQHVKELITIKNLTLIKFLMQVQLSRIQCKRQLLAQKHVVTTTCTRSLRSVHSFLHSSYQAHKILRFTMLFNRPDTRKRAPSCGVICTHVIHVPSTHPIRHHKLHLERFSANATYFSSLVKGQIPFHPIPALSRFDCSNMVADRFEAGRGPVADLLARASSLLAS